MNSKNQASSASKTRENYDSLDDNLEEIEGIGPEYAKALNRIGICSFTDLAQYETADRLQQVLSEQANVDVPLWKIEKRDWLGQAKSLATTETSAMDRSLPMEEVDFLSTTEQLPQSDESFPRLVPVVTAETVASVPAISSPEETRIEITEVQVSEVGPTSGLPEKQLQAQIRIHISGPAADRLTANRSPFRVEVHTVELENDESSLVASGRSHLQPKVFEYKNRQRFPIPEVGRYRVYCITLLLPPGDLAAYYEGPIINIGP